MFILHRARTGNDPNSILIRVQPPAHTTIVAGGKRVRAIEIVTAAAVRKENSVWTLLEK